MPNDTIYHRTLSLAYDPSPNSNLLPASQPWTRGYWMSHVLNNYLKSPVDLYIKPLQYFEDYATQFEKDFSSVIPKDGTSMHPIIDNNPAEVQSGAYAAWPDHEVIAHLGWVWGSHVHIPKVSGATNTKLSNFLADNVPVWVAKVRPSGYTSYASEQYFLLGTHIDGRVLWYLDYDVTGLESSKPTFKKGVTKAGTAVVRKAAGVTTVDLIKSVVRTVLFKR